MIITVANTKGGTGKTTTAVQIALYLRTQKKRRVWLVDGDDQESALTAVSIRSDSGVEPSLACSAYSDARTLLTQVDAQREVWDDIVIDMGGRDTGALRAALTQTDILVIPVRPRSLDIWALSRMMNIIDDARMMGYEFKVVAFLSNADSQGSDNTAAGERLKEVDQLEFIDTPLVQRKAFTTACSQGLCVTEVKPKDQKAISELKALVETVLRIGGAK